MYSDESGYTMAAVEEQTPKCARLTVEVEPNCLCEIKDDFREIFEREMRVEEEIERWLEKERSFDEPPEYEADDPFAIDEPTEDDPFVSINEPSVD